LGEFPYPPRNYVESELDLVGRAVAYHVGVRPRELREIPSYTDTIVYFARIQDKTLYFKAADPYGLDRSRIEAEAWACTAAAGVGVPAPRIIALDSTRAQFPAPYLLMESVAGEPMSRAHLTPHDLQRASREFGAVLRRLHSVEVEGFGPLSASEGDLHGAPAGQYATWKSAVVSEVQRALLYLSERDLIQPQLRSLLQGLLSVDTFLSDIASHGRLLHGDPGASHVYVDTDGHVVGVIDFGTPWSGDPLWDLASLNWEGETDVDEVIEGYGPSVSDSRATEHISAYALCQAGSLGDVVSSARLRTRSLRSSQRRDPCGTLP